MTILGCAHPQYGALAQIGFQILPLAYRIRNTISTQNDTALFEKGRLISTKGLNIVFFYYFTFDYSIEMDQNNLAIILNTTNLHYYKTDYYEIQNFFSVPKNGLHIIKQDYILGDGDFFRILNCEGRLNQPHI